MRAKRVDANQKKIVEQLRKIGASVTVTSMIGEGFPDVVVGFRGKNFLIEIKDESKSPSQRKLTPDEQRWHLRWRGQAAICKNFDEILDIINK